MQKQYAIKPLIWEDDIIDELNARTSFGSYFIKKVNGSIRCGYCFDEYYDEDDFCCDSFDDGKTMCEQMWIKRLESDLLFVKSTC